MCDTPGECSDVSNDEGGYNARAWQVGDLTVNQFG